MGRLTFIMFLVFSLPVGMHHLFADPEYGSGFKFLQSFLTFLVMLPTLLTVFSICASLEIAGPVRGGRGLLGWIPALPWEEPVVLAVGLSLVMLGLGGFGGIINMSYAMNMMIHNTSWVTAHFHLIFGGAVVIIYFAIAYEMWPRITGKPLRSKPLARYQLWLWFWGMLTGLMGQPRRVATFDYADPLIAPMGPLVIISVIGGLILLISATLLIVILVRSHFGARMVGAPSKTGRIRPGNGRDARLPCAWLRLHRSSASNRHCGPDCSRSNREPVRASIIMESSRPSLMSCRASARSAGARGANTLGGRKPAISSTCRPSCRTMEINPSDSEPFRWVVVRSTATPIVVNLPDDTWS
jgi:hypothetical protein